MNMRRLVGLVISLFLPLVAVAEVHAHGQAEADADKAVAIRWWGQAMVSIETHSKLRIVIDPYAARVGYPDPEVAADLVLVTHEHGDHSNVKLVRGDPQVVRGLDADKEVVEQDLILDRPANGTKAKATPTAELAEPSDDAVRIRAIKSFHDDVLGQKRGRNALFVIEVDGVRILHCGDLGQTKLTDAQLEAIGKIDVVLIPVGSVYTVDGKQAAALVEKLRPRLVVPIHYKTPVLKVNLNGVEPFLEALPEKFTVIRPKGNELTVVHGGDPDAAHPRAVVLDYRPSLTAEQAE